METAKKYNNTPNSISEPYTIEELNARIDLAERQSAAGKVKSTKEVFKKYEKELNDFAQETDKEALLGYAV